MKNYSKYIIIFILATIIGFIFTKASAQTQRVEIYSDDWRGATELMPLTVACTQTALGISTDDKTPFDEQVNKPIRFKQRGSYTAVKFKTQPGRVLIIGRKNAFREYPVTIKVVEVEAPTVKISLPMDDPIDTSYWITDIYEMSVVYISR